MNGHKIEGELFFSSCDSSTPGPMLLPRSFRFSILETLRCVMDEMLTGRIAERRKY